MATKTERLADGSVDTSAAAIFTAKLQGVANSVSNREKFYVNITSLIFFNTNATEQTLVVYHKKFGGSNTMFARAILPQFNKMVLGEEEIPILRAGDEIQAETTTSSAVNFFVSGVSGT